MEFVLYFIWKKIIGQGAINMIIKPKVRGFICTTAHPAGCAANVKAAAELAAESKGSGPKSVLVIGGSAGYGLACRVVAAMGYNAATVSVAFEREAAGNRTATAGWYNTAAFDALARERGLTSVSINGDAFAAETKEQVIREIKAHMPDGKVDLVIYSLAAPKRTDHDGVTYSSAIKPIGEVFSGRTVDFHTGVVSTVEVAPATQEEISGTVKVMGGEDWLLWIKALMEADALADGAVTLAFSYIGPGLTHAIYKDGTIGRAKIDLEQKACEITAMLAPINGRGLVSVNKALVTQASSAIPVVPLYIALLYRVMKDRGLHEGCTEQMIRMFRRLYTSSAEIPTDEAGRIRMDDLEMQEDVQDEVLELWDKVTGENIEEISDLRGYRDDFYRLFGFGIDNINYDSDIEY
jgi:enoyl-[acyl-carrier protein] reductase/trans-2-enoyl-CoA reductase (NAD+)